MKIIRMVMALLVLMSSGLHAESRWPMARGQVAGLDDAQRAFSPSSSEGSRGSLPVNTGANRAKKRWKALSADQKRIVVSRSERDKAEKEAAARASRAGVLATLYSGKGLSKPASSSPYADQDWYKALTAKPETRAAYNGYDGGSKAGDNRPRRPPFDAFMSQYKPDEFTRDKNGDPKNAAVRFFSRIGSNFTGRHPLPTGLKHMVYMALRYASDRDVRRNFDLYKAGMMTPEMMRQEYADRFAMRKTLRNKHNPETLFNRWDEAVGRDTAGADNFPVGITSYVGNLVAAATMLRRAQYNGFGSVNFDDPTFDEGSQVVSSPMRKRKWESLAANEDFTNFLWNFVCDIENGEMKKGYERAGLAVRDAVSTLLFAQPHHSDWHGLGFADLRPEAYQARWKDLLRDKHDYCIFALPVIFHVIRLRTFLGFDVPYYTRAQQAMWRYTWGRRAAGATAAATAATLMAPTSVPVAITGASGYGLYKAGKAYRGYRTARKQNRSTMAGVMGTDV